jgi:ABC-type dipeptide/oligopeptide/nickel transport system permease component
MVKLIVSRLLAIVPVALIAVLFIFLIVQLAPGDPAVSIAGSDATAEEVEAIRIGLGLDRPLYEQFWNWLVGLSQGDLGTSLVSKLAIGDIIGNRIAATVQLALAGAILAIVLGVTIGSIAAIRRGGAIDATVSVGTGIAMATPEFWFGTLLVLVFAVELGWLPAQGMPLLTADPARAALALVLPALAISLHPTALIARTVRASVAKTLADDYIRTARAKGAWGVRLGADHVLRNALVPILAIIGVELGGMLGGAVVIESVFAIPGLGNLLVSAVGNRDYPVVQATLLILMIGIVVVNLITDIAYGIADPRIRSGAASRNARR